VSVTEGVLYRPPPRIRAEGFLERPLGLVNGLLKGAELPEDRPIIAPGGGGPLDRLHVVADRAEVRGDVIAGEQGASPLSRAGASSGSGRSAAAGRGARRGPGT
jgi:hypothetical protein